VVGKASARVQIKLNRGFLFPDRVPIGSEAADGDCPRVRGRPFREIFDSQFDSADD